MGSRRSDPEHDDVLAASGGHLVVVAPPGTGKTYLSAMLAGQLAEELEPHERVLLLTFSNQARTQLEQEAAKQLSAQTRRSVEVTNYHRLFWEAVRAHRRALGIDAELDIGSVERRRAAIRGAGKGLVDSIEDRPGLLECLAEHRYPEFRDDRTPVEEVLERLLDVVGDEQRQGRLVFDDLGALFWELMGRFPTIEQAFRDRYPIVIADEHQDASELQDRVIRRIATRRLIVFADPMQLIHEFRGASDRRLERHLAEADKQLPLSTPHRWHGNDEVASWLLALRARLSGEQVDLVRPQELSLFEPDGRRGMNGIKSSVRSAVSAAFDSGCKSVAVLVRANEVASDLRSYLSRKGQYPTQVGTDDFEDARCDIETLPSLVDSQALALHAVERIESLVPGLPTTVLSQVRARVGEAGLNLDRAGTMARQVLEALTPIFTVGSSAYFRTVVAALELCRESGHHLPRPEAVRALSRTAESLPDATSLDECLTRYAEETMVASHRAPRPMRGLYVMTAHQSKGKEFDGVILADGMARYWGSDDATRRLFYVALTRATRSWMIVAPTGAASPLIPLVAG